MKFHLLLPPVMLALCGCHSDLYYQEQAVESARKFIYKNARELTPEQFAHIRLTPPVLLTGPVLKGSVKIGSEISGEKMQICVAWRVPEQKTDYLVFGMSESRMEYWRPLKLIRRKIIKVDGNAQKAMKTAREYAMNALHEQLTAAELNTVRFAHPALARTSFELETKEDPKASAVPRPWKKFSSLKEDGKGILQLSLLWKISKGRYVVFCGTGKKDLGAWQIAMAGVIDEAEVKRSTVKLLKTSEQFLVPEKHIPAADAGENQKKTAAGGK